MTADESVNALIALRNAGLIATPVRNYNGVRARYRVHWQSAYASGSFEDYADVERIIAAQGKREAE